MSKVKFNNGKIKMEVSGKELFVVEQVEKLKELFEGKKSPDGKLIIAIGEMDCGEPIQDEGKKNTEECLADDGEVTGGVEHAVVAIYDNAGIPSFMHRLRKVTDKELFGGSGKTHPAFVIGGEEYDEIYISVYENCEVNGKPYSLPMMKPWTDITNDQAAEACFSKGDGWHLMTRAEWGLLANLSLKNGTLPHGNTNYGKYHANEEEKGEPCGSGKTLTGSGPATWTHNHTPEGVHDLCGNVWEMVRGLRLKNGKLQAAKNNDAAMDIDLAEDGGCWKDVLDDTGKPIRISVNEDGEIAFTSEPESEYTVHNYDGCIWQDVKIECASEQMKELALFPGEPEAYIYADSTSGERLPVCGGGWNYSGNAGVFGVDLYSPRTHAYGTIGFRSAYYRKRTN